jgi:heme A synthase
MKISRFAKFVWFVLAYNLAVIAWGAFVRASGSGAGCGSHWPLCNGEILPHSRPIETLIELTHRSTSGLALLFILVMAVFAFRLYPRGHRVRLGAVLTVVFILTEALVGAGLVIFELVLHDASLARAIFMSVHLVNTFILLAALTLTAWWASGGAPVYLRRQGALLWLFLAGLAGSLLLGVSGAVAALGDTLYPAASLSEGFRQDFSSTASVLIRLRLLHPTLAVTVGLGIMIIAFLARRARSNESTRSFALVLPSLVAVQLIAGVANVFLLAPIWMQLVHLLLADAVWLALILLMASALSQRPQESFEEARMRSAATTAGA